MKFVLVLAAALLFGGCGGDAKPVAKPEPKPVVSLQTTCDRLFSQGPGEKGLWGETTDVVAESANNGVWSESQAKSVNERLADIAETSEAGLRPHIETMAKMVSSEDALDVSTYKTAGTEVANQCAPYVAG